MDLLRSGQTLGYHHIAARLETNEELVRTYRKIQKHTKDTEHTKTQTRKHNSRTARENTKIHYGNPMFLPYFAVWKKQTNVVLVPKSWFGHRFPLTRMTKTSTWKFLSAGGLLRPVTVSTNVGNTSAWFGSHVHTAKLTPTHNLLKSWNNVKTNEYLPQCW